MALQWSPRHDAGGVVSCDFRTCSKTSGTSIFYIIFVQHHIQGGRGKKNHKDSQVNCSNETGKKKKASVLGQTAQADLDSFFFLAILSIGSGFVHSAEHTRNP